MLPALFEPTRGIALKSVDSWDAAIGGDAICSANCVPNCSKWKRGKGRSSSTSIKPTVASKVSSPKTRSSAAKKQSAPRRARSKQKKYAQRSSHCFVMGLLITPSGMRLPFSVSYYTEAYCKAKKIAYRKQTELAAQLIRQLPLPPEARVVVLGDTAFDAEAIRTACEERKFSWIVPINPERVLAGEKPRPKVSSLSEDLTADQMVCLKVHPGKGKYVDYRRISRYRIGPKFKPRTYYVHEESRDVHSVGKVRLFFSTTKAPAQGHQVEVQKILMTNDEKLTLRDVIELYQLRWQIELFFKELKSTLGLHHYRFKKFEKAETWVTLCLVTFVYLEWIRAHKLKQKALKKKEREWWQAQRTYGLALAVRQEAEQRELKLLAEKMETPAGRKVLAKQLRQRAPVTPSRQRRLPPLPTPVPHPLPTRKPWATNGTCPRKKWSPRPTLR